MHTKYFVKVNFCYSYLVLDPCQCAVRLACAKSAEQFLSQCGEKGKLIIRMFYLLQMTNSSNLTCVS